jgi:dihydrolipoamide dehydrogenase
MTKQADVLVIGAGTAGLSAYRAAAARDGRVFLVERGPGGTTCARVGCMPSKLLVAAADAAHRARHAGLFGVDAAPRIDGVRVMDRVRRERDRFVGLVLEGLETIPEDHKLRGEARFVAPNVVDIGGARVEARAIVVATGSSPIVPRMFDGVRDRVAVNDDVFAWHDLPRSVAVFGTGVIGLELGQALGRLGVRVRLFGKGGKLGPITDPVVHAAVLRALGGEVELDPDAPTPAIEPAPRGSGVLVDGERFDALLVAAGRRPNLLGLGLDAVAAGMPVVDRHTLRWADTPVFIAGDANVDVPLLHEAADEGRIAGENAARYPDVRPALRRSPLAIAFTDPQIAVVGSSWAELSASAASFVSGAIEFHDQGRSRVMGENHGAARVYADAHTGRLLGAEMAGPRAENIGHLLAWAHQQGLTIDQMLAMPFYHPVVEEGIRTALRDAASKLTRATRQTGENR